MVFDLGKVLVDFDWMIVADRLARRSGKTLADFQPLIADPSLLLDYESGRYSSLEFYDKVRDLLGYSGSFEDFHGDFGDMFTEIPEMVEVSRRIRQSGIPTWILSNTNEIAIETIRRQFPFFADFDGYVYSYEVQSMKPDSAIYRALEDQTGVSGSAVIFIDDNAANIEGARQLGWTAMHHTDHENTVRFLKESGVLQT